MQGILSILRWALGTNHYLARIHISFIFIGHSVVGRDWWAITEISALGIGTPICKHLFYLNVPGIDLTLL